MSPPSSSSTPTSSSTPSSATISSMMLTSTTTTKLLVPLRFQLHLFWQGTYMIHTLSKAEIINGVIFPDEEIAPTVIARVVANLESTNPYANLSFRFCVPILEQFQQHRVLILQYITSQCGFSKN